MKKKIFIVLALAAVVHISTWSLQDIAFLVIVVVVGVGFEYLQQHDQVVKQRTAQRAELITRLDRWQHDVKGTATPSGDQSARGRRGERLMMDVETHVRVQKIKLVLIGLCLAAATWTLVQ